VKTGGRLLPSLEKKLRVWQPLAKNHDRSRIAPSLSAFPASWCKWKGVA